MISCLLPRLTVEQSEATPRGRINILIPGMSFKSICPIDLRVENGGTGSHNEADIHLRFFNFQVFAGSVPHM